MLTVVVGQRLKLFARNITGSARGAKFYDKARIEVVGGNGGIGSKSNYKSGPRRERPDGGDGGPGGSVFLKGTRSKNHLQLGKFLFRGEKGGIGLGNNQTGKGGEHLFVLVPCGTTVFKNDQYFGDIVDEDQVLEVVKGGNGGGGSQAFTKGSNKLNYSSVMERMNEHSFEGEVGEKAELLLQLKLLADVGLVGFPNAGKSSALSVLSRKKPKIGSYEFTTLSPTIGVLFQDEMSIKIADIPGITESTEVSVLDKAVSKKSHDFLQHIERTSCFLYVLGLPSALELGNVVFEPDQKDVVFDILLQRLTQELTTLINELEKYQEGLSLRKGLLVLNKVDNLDDILVFENKQARNQFANEIAMELCAQVPLQRPVDDVAVISAKHKIGVDELKKKIATMFSTLTKEKPTTILPGEESHLLEPEK